MMAELTQKEKDLLGPIIKPFDRSDKSADKKKPKDGEIERDDFMEFIHTVIWDGEPPQHITLNQEEIASLRSNPLAFRENKILYREKCFLWVIDNSSLRIIREKTRNARRTHDSEFVCHTNLTAWGEAYIGGELFFGDDGNIYINFFSDRYGNPSVAQWETAKQFFIRIGYQNLIDILNLI